MFLKTLRIASLFAATCAATGAASTSLAESDPGGLIKNAQIPTAKPAPPAAPAQPRQRTAGNGSGGFFGALFGGGGPGRGGSNKNAMLEAYPGAFRIQGNEIIFPSGERMVWDDGRRKSPEELLTDADVEDTFAYPYPPASKGDQRPPRDHDPGRVRNDDFFRALYGASAGEVTGTLRNVAWVPRLGGGNVAVTTRFGVADKLAAVSADLERLPTSFHKYLRPSAGTFLWRNISGTNRLSVHSFGAAIDINTHYANYWQWDEQPADGRILYRNEIPMEIVEIFERHCFIWGGRWYHYDTMHFEYRPELLPGCRN